MANVIRFSPASDLFQLQREFDQIFNSLFPSRSMTGRTADNAAWSPRADVAETEDAYVVQLDLPGVSRENIEIDFHEGTLVVSGSRTSERKDEKENYVRLERASGHFSRTFNVPKTVDTNKIEAAYKDGVLTIQLPKTEESKPRRIAVS